jgi:hypothetical protein
MAELKTKVHEASVDEFLDKVADPQKREDAKQLRTMLERVSGHPAKMWGPSIIGFGAYHYKYDSGHEGDMARIGFSPRAKELVVYLVPGFEDKEQLLGRLGKHKIGKSCLYIKRLTDVDQNVLEQLAGRSLDYMREKYPEDA